MSKNELTEDFLLLQAENDRLKEKIGLHECGMPEKVILALADEGAPSWLYEMAEETSLWDFCRATYFEHSGEKEVGIPSSKGYNPDEDQSGTLLEKIEERLALQFKLIQRGLEIIGEREQEIVRLKQRLAEWEVEIKR